ncbi:MAG: GntR family transcriptional regulator [Treponema sp.]|nr:GntR family transcriptional regulator [Treponema sp.]
MKEIEKDPKETNREYALRAIKENIINLSLVPGSMISEQEIASDLNLSRTPVHEAIQELSKIKVIEVYPQKGSRVSLIDMDLIDESVFIRSTLESAITGQACKNATEEDIKNLQENISLQEFYNSKGNTDKILELDNKFHEIFYKITNRMQCFYMVKMVSIHYDRYRKLKLVTRDRLGIIEDHKAILKAFEEKNVKKAKELSIKHLQQLHIDEQDIRLKYPAYFKN